VLGFPPNGRRSTISRGLGQVELFVLDTLNDNGFNPFGFRLRHSEHGTLMMPLRTLAGFYHTYERAVWAGPGPDRVAVETIRRAVKSLERKGLVHTFYEPAGGIRRPRRRELYVTTRRQPQS
jgi:hypothetical protein